jgi:hypothetical protein
MGASGPEQSVDSANLGEIQHLRITLGQYVHNHTDLNVPESGTDRKDGSLHQVSGNGQWYWPELKSVCDSSGERNH